MRTFFPLLGLLFIGLKLTGYISWSWWLVLLPMYGAAAVVLGVTALGLATVAFLKLLERSH